MNDNQNTPDPPRRRSMLASILMILIVATLGWWLLTSMLQERFIFPRFIANNDVPTKTPDDVEVIMVGPDQGVEALFLPASTGDDPAPLLVLLHGNAELADHWIDFGRSQSARGYAVLIPEYPGYGRSAGEPGQDRIRECVLESIERVTDRPEVDGDHVGFLGRSIGTAVAADVALRRTPDCMVFIVPPASISGFAWGYGVPPLLIRHPFRTDLALPQLDVPLLICSHSQDEVVPPAQSAMLHDVAMDSTLLEFEGRHNFLFEDSDRIRRRRAIEDHLDANLR